MLGTGAGVLEPHPANAALDPSATQNAKATAYPFIVLSPVAAREHTAIRVDTTSPEIILGGLVTRSKTRACRVAGVAVRNLARNDIPERVAMQMTGHQTESVFQRYNIVSDGDLREAAHKLNAAGGR